MTEIVNSFHQPSLTLSAFISDDVTQVKRAGNHHHPFNEDVAEGRVDCSFDLKGQELF